ncbi:MULTISPECIES: DUF2892 domain-containing protein [Haloferax]|uniref:DUF2892 domain-containing protein n=1 Tax=Haloferax marinum TaxID=2666143 RepID=A0A6A8G9H9_9EURY|nr:MULTISPECIES: DUF2892 domain-containing protein [Haloferax]KAB1198280.1 DUF2892 domain-containing protein [Haloferax sp. CBA1150]MRW97375.1 DUF2892 domain-containing protein [Haloferax marinum]
MEHNVGSLDRTVRLALGALLVVVGLGAFAGLVPLGTIPAAIGVVLGAVFLVTGYQQTCPLYLPFGINTSDKR